LVIYLSVPFKNYFSSAFYNLFYERLFAARTADQRKKMFARLQTKAPPSQLSPETSFSAKKT
jgi:hypothetical protein